MNQYDLPLVQAMRTYVTADPVRLHMPGHSGGRSAPLSLQSLWGKAIWQYDLTELPQTDDLYQPAGPIALAQALAAGAFGAQRTFFLVGGASAGIVASMLAVAASGTRVIIPRNFHRSLWSGLVLSGAEPLYVYPQYWDEQGLNLGVSLAEYRRVLTQNQNAKMIVVVRPTYEGLSGDLSALVSLAHELGSLVVVDEAHGAHFGFADGYPQSASQLGADVAVQGSHKTIGALTQGAMLHLNNLSLEPELVSALPLVQSSSPSFLILASLDAARSQMAVRGKRLLSIIRETASGLAEALAAVEGFRVLNDELINCDLVESLDPVKLILDPRGRGYTGTRLFQILGQQGYQAEYATEEYLLFWLTAGASRKRLKEMVNFLHGLPPQNKAYQTSFLPPPRPEIALMPREAHFAPKRAVSLKKAEGLVCAELIVPYPPGIPVLCPGEILTTEMVEYLCYLNERKVSLQGAYDPTLNTVMVVKD